MRGRSAWPSRVSRMVARAHYDVVLIQIFYVHRYLRSSAGFLRVARAFWARSGSAAPPSVAPPERACGNVRAKVDL